MNIGESVNPLIATIAVLNPFYYPNKSLILGKKCVFKVSKFANVLSKIKKK